jgi:polyhydroxyalkanoate synthesis regulator phasin
MANFFERGFLATVGVLSMTREKTQEMVDDLIQRGELNRDEGKQLVERMVRRGQKEQESMRNLVRQEVQRALQELEMVRRQDLEALSAKMDLILQKLDERGSE